MFRYKQLLTNKRFISYKTNNNFKPPTPNPNFIMIFIIFYTISNDRTK
uniref:Uncharacterized protein n=1 Tax=viral metagenome TaxID=1070528 RepID=A0A6C0DCX6_9ZZZZ